MAFRDCTRAAPSAGGWNSGRTRKADVGLRLRARRKKNSVIWKPVPNRADSLKRQKCSMRKFFC